MERQIAVQITESPLYPREGFLPHNISMPEDELEHLRAILARVYDKPPKGRGVRTIMQRIAKGFFVTPKKVIIERVKQQSPPKKDAA